MNKKQQQHHQYIDSGACGIGKTVGTIYPKINQLLSLDKKILLVCPSIKLLDQYKAKFSKLQVINHCTSNQSVVLGIIDALVSNTQFIGITAQAFLLLPANEMLSDYEHIFDEALDNLFSTNKFTFKTNDIVQFDWDGHFDIIIGPDQPPIEEEVLNEKSEVYYKLKVKNIARNSITDSNPKYRQLICRNFDHYMTARGIKSLCECHARPTEEFSIYSKYNGDNLKNVPHSYVAAANYQNTAMYAVCNGLGYDMKYVRDFEPHSAKLTIHTLSENQPSFSNTKRKENHTLMENFNNYVIANTTGTILSLCNVSEKSVLPGEVTLSHAIHGLNKPEYMASNDVALRTLLNVDSCLRSFIYNIVLDYIPDQQTKSRLTASMISANTLYQSAMRCSLRDRTNNNHVNLYVANRESALILATYFKSPEIVTFEIFGEKTRKLAMTGTERSRKFRYKKKEAAIAKLIAIGYERSDNELVSNEQLGDLSPPPIDEKCNDFSIAVIEESLHHDVEIELRSSLQIDDDSFVATQLSHQFADLCFLAVYGMWYSIWTDTSIGHKPNINYLQVATALVLMFDSSTKTSLPHRVAIVRSSNSTNHRMFVTKTR